MTKAKVNEDNVKWIPGVKQKPNAFKSNPTTIEAAFKQVMPFVHSQAKRWTRNHFQYYEDFVSAGYEGVCVAWSKFHGTDFEKNGYRFSTYCHWHIRERQQHFAHKLWNNFNNSTELTEFNQDQDTYEMDLDLIDVRKAFAQLTEQEQKLVQLRMEGETFDVIAEQLGYNSLHQARNDFMRVSEQLRA